MKDCILQWSHLWEVVWLSASIRLITPSIQRPALSTHFSSEECKKGTEWSGWWDGRSSIVKHPLTRDYWRAFTGEFRPWKETFLATMDPVCVAGAADMNRAPKCITVTRQPVINANKMKGPYQKRQTQTWAVSEQKTVKSLFWLKPMHLFVLFGCYIYIVCMCAYVGLHTCTLQSFLWH